VDAEEIQKLDSRLKVKRKQYAVKKLEVELYMAQQDICNDPNDKENEAKLDKIENALKEAKDQLPAETKTVASQTIPNVGVSRTESEILKKRGSIFGSLCTRAK